MAISIGHLSEESLKWAASEALAQWLGEEGSTHVAFVKATADSSSDLQLFRSFLAKWGIARHSTFEAKEPMFRVYVTEWLPAWRDSMPNDVASFRSVEEVSRSIKSDGWSTSRVTSLASKLAFMANPMVFVPYDKTSRTALRSFGYSIADHDHVAYMNAFGKMCDENADALRDASTLLIGVIR
jgi:hypothetical protein